MPGRRPWVAAIALIGVLGAAAVFVWLQRDSASSVELVERDQTGAVDTIELVDPAEAQARIDQAAQAQQQAEEQAAADAAAAALLAAEQAEQDALDAVPAVDVTSLARGPLSDEDFDELVGQLRTDPALLSALIDEARSETDPERLARLLRLLGEVDDPAVVALATELVYSGDTGLQTLGLDLMKRVRPGDPDVLASVSGLLSTEVDGQVLVPALTALALTGNTDDATRASLAGQVAVLTDHGDPAVRRTSLTILSRWSNDATYTPQLLSGLDDGDATVRRAAAFALVGHGDTSYEVRQKLMGVADSAASGEAARRGAILALKRMPLDDAEREQVLAIERGLDSRPLR